MISHLSGKVIHAEDKFAVIETGGVGYKIFVTADAALESKKRLGGPASFWTHLAVRENALDLYGFTQKEELDFFELLLGVSGIGPKTALGVLFVATIKNLRKAIASGETAHLIKVSGVGKKIADKIVLELRDKIDFLEGEADTGDMRDESDAVETLKALGYNEREAREAMKKVPEEVSGTGARVKSALKILGK